MWTITGQAGKALDATSRTLAEIGALNPKVTFRSLAADSMTWGVMLAGLAPGAELIPEIGQEMALYRSGVRVFCGHVANVRQSGRNIAVTVNNAWWWLERVFLSSTQTDGTGATGTRASFALSAGDLSTSFAGIANAAIALGVPMQLGALAATFNAPELRLNQQSFGQALAEVARVTPDLVTWFDYSVAGLPALRTSRRLSAGTVTIDAEAEVGIDLNPLTELEVSAVDIPYLVRAADGAKQFAMQSAGTRAMGKTQLLTVSGDEMDTFLPKDLLESVAAASYNHPTLGNNVSAYVWEHDPSLGKALGWPNYGAGSIANSLDFYTVPINKVVASPVHFPNYNVQGPDGTPASGYMLLSNSLPEWAMVALGAVRAVLSGTWVVTWPESQGPWPEWYQMLQVGAQTGAGHTGASGLTLVNYTYYLARPFQVECILTPAFRAAPGTLYRPSDYGFVAPPAGFSAGLLAAQSYLPYEGTITIPAEECGATRYLPTAINVSNARPQFASMRAMVSSEEWDLQTGETTIVLGPPARFSYRDLVNRLRGSSNDNIVYL